MTRGVILYNIRCRLNTKVRLVTLEKKKEGEREREREREREKEIVKI